jgi:hypothetical protein
MESIYLSIAVGRRKAEAVLIYLEFGYPMRIRQSPAIPVPVLLNFGKAHSRSKNNKL